MDSPRFNDSATAIEMVNVSKTFGPVRALQGVSLRIRHGELAVLLGPNGAGKSTALSLMLGLRQPSIGTVRVGGRDPRDMTGRAKMGAMLQGTSLPPLRVCEVLDLFGSFHTPCYSTHDVLTVIRLSSQARRCVSELSAGERQRLLLGIALIGNPDVLILDEPTVFMDVECRSHFWRLVRELAARGRTALVATHHPEEVAALADRVIVMTQGTIVEDGSPEQIRRLAGTERLEQAVMYLMMRDRRVAE